MASYREYMFSWRDRRASAALAAGMLVSTAGALWAGATMGIGEVLLLEIGLLGLLAGFAGLFRPMGKAARAMGAAEPFLWLPAVLPGLVQGRVYTAAVFWALAMAAASLFLLFCILGSEMRSETDDTGPADRQAIPGIIFHLGIGVLLAALFLPLTGPFLMAAAALALRLTSLPGKRIGYVLLSVAVIVSLGGMAFVESRGMKAEDPSSPVKSSDSQRRRWYVDGPAEISSGEGGVGSVSLAGGRYGWVLSPGSRGEADDFSTAPSARLARRLMSGKPNLILGPAASARLERISDKLPGEIVTLPGDRRLAFWYRAGSHQEPSAEVMGEGEVSNSGIRRYLSGVKKRFGLIYYVDLYDTEALSRGAASQDPAYHLTVEAFEGYLRALKSKGFLLLEVPFGLKVAGILKEIGSRGDFTAERHLLIYRDRAASRDIVVFSRTPLTRKLIVKLNRFAVKNNLGVRFYPGRKGKKSSFNRLIRSQNARGFYTGLSTELIPPSDGRPFFYRVNKTAFRHSPRDEAVLASLGIQPAPGWVPPADMPWAFLAVIGLGVILFFFLGQRPAEGTGEGLPPWRLRFFFFHYLIGFVLGLALRGGLMTLFRGDLGSLPLLPAGALFLAVALAAAFYLKEWGEGDPGSLLPVELRLMLPALLLPLLAGLMPEGFWSLLPGLTFTAVTLVPSLLIGGMILWSGLDLCRAHRSLEEAAVLALSGLGALTGLEAVIPVAQIFGFAFTQVLAWGVLFVSVRVVQRVPTGEFTGTDNGVFLSTR